MDNFLSSYVADSENFHEENILNIKNYEKNLNLLSAAEFKKLLIDLMKILKDEILVVETEIECVLKLKRSNADSLRVKLETIQKLTNILAAKKEKLKFQNANVTETKEIVVQSNETDKENVADAIDVGVVRKPRLSDYDFSQETLALIKNDVGANNSNIKPPKFKDYEFCSKTMNNAVKKINDQTKMSNRKSLKNTTNFNHYEKITPNIFISDSDDAGSSSNPKTAATSKESLMHSGSLDGSLIKLTPYCELDYNFSNGHKLQNPDFDSASDDTTSVTIIERPQMPQFEAVLDACPAAITKPEFPKLLARELYDSPVNEQSKPAISVGAFKPVPQTDRRKNFNVIGDVRRSIAPDMNVTYVVSKTDETLSDGTFGKILPLTRQEYSSLEPFIVTKVSFADVNKVVEKINLYLEMNDTNVLTKMDLAAILPYSDSLNFYFTLILTKFGRLKKLQAEETFFECL